MILPWLGHAIRRPARYGRSSIATAKHSHRNEPCHHAFPEGFGIPGTFVPRYHFDFVDSKTVADQGGSELPDDLKALDVAEELARRLARDRPDLKGRHFSILVTNQDGEEIGRVPLDRPH